MWTSLRNWMVKGECLFAHSEPYHDRVHGQACFRCPTCLATWPKLSTGDGTLHPEVVNRERRQAAAFWAGIAARDWARRVMAEARDTVSR